jgi:hypothetical protein
MVILAVNKIYQLDAVVSGYRLPTIVVHLLNYISPESFRTYNISKRQNIFHRNLACDPFGNRIGAIGT